MHQDCPVLLLDTGCQRFRFHDHAGSAAVGGVINGMVPVNGKVPDLMQADPDQPLVLAPADNCFRQTVP